MKQLSLLRMIINGNRDYYWTNPRHYKYQTFIKLQSKKIHKTQEIIREIHLDLLLVDQENEWNQ